MNPYICIPKSLLIPINPPKSPRSRKYKSILIKSLNIFSITTYGPISKIISYSTPLCG